MFVILTLDQSKTWPTSRGVQLALKLEIYNLDLETTTSTQVTLTLKQP